MFEPLIQAIRSGQALLFAGSGVSRNLGLPSWSELIDKMAHDLSYDPQIFRSHGDYLELAEYYQLKKTSMGALRSWMDRNWHKDEHKVDDSLVHQAIISLKSSTIYTTNYDRWLEISFQRRNVQFTKIANVGDFTKIQDGITQIIKLHW